MYNKPYPWLPGDAVRFLDEYLNREMDVLEFGCGQSTIWISHRVNMIHSVETNETWALHFKNKFTIDNVNANIEINLHPWESPKRADMMWDFILVDGRKRVWCFTESLPYLKPGGVIMLDNSEREEYAECFDLVKGWEQHDSFGPDYTGEWTYPNWKCTWWIKK